MKTIKQIKTSNKIIISFFLITFIFSYISLFRNNTKYHSPHDYAEHLYKTFRTDSIKVVSFSGDYHPTSVVLSSPRKKYLNFNFIPTPETIYIKSDTLYISTSKSFKIQLPGIQYCIINGLVHNVFDTSNPTGKLDKPKE